VRYYGFNSSASKEKWKIIAKYFNLKTDTIESTANKISNKVKEVFCRHCKSKMVQQASILRKSRSPPEKIIQRLLKQFTKTD
jgi:RNase P subunit RPR2